MALRRYNQCEGSQRRYTEFAGITRPDTNHRMPCPFCGKVVKLREDLSPVTFKRQRVTIPTHTPGAKGE